MNERSIQYIEHKYRKNEENKNTITKNKNIYREQSLLRNEKFANRSD